MSNFRSGFVSFVGRPNSGKSTLLNRMVGQKVSITSSNPQTTRNRIQGIKSTEQYQIVFVDTPGIHKPLHRMNERMMRSCESALGGVDVVALLVDVTQQFGSGDAFALRMLENAVPTQFLLLNKIDRVAKETILPLTGRYAENHSFDAIIPISALTGEGCDILEAELLKRLPEGPRYFPEDIITDFPERFIAQEFIREKVLSHTRHEIPYATAVRIRRFQDNPEKGIIAIEADILVERESQKPIIIGKKASLIKIIGTEARRDLEAIFNTKVFLQLVVKKKEGWRENGRLLKEMGLD